jgi:hypothetical protein
VSIKSIQHKLVETIHGAFSGTTISEEPAMDGLEQLSETYNITKLKDPKVLQLDGDMAFTSIDVGIKSIDMLGNNSNESISTAGIRTIHLNLHGPLNTISINSDGAASCIATKPLLVVSPRDSRVCHECAIYIDKHPIMDVMVERGPVALYGIGFDEWLLQDISISDHNGSPMLAIGRRNGEIQHVIIGEGAVVSAEFILPGGSQAHYKLVNKGDAPADIEHALHMMKQALSQYDTHA